MNFNLEVAGDAVICGFTPFDTFKRFQLEIQEN